MAVVEQVPKDDGIRGRLVKAKVLRLLALGFLLVTPLPTLATGVVIGGKEWRQLTDTTNWSWDQVATVCDQTTGVCDGSLGGVTFVGWTWAALSDVQALFYELFNPSPAVIASPDNFWTYGAFGDPAIAAALGPGGFAPTGINALAERAAGLYRGDPGYSLFAPLASIVNSFAPSGFDSATVLQGATRSVQRVDIGSWMYRPVPEPGTLALLALGLAGLGMNQRRKAA